MRVFLALGMNDLRSIGRDSLLMYMFLLPWLLVLMLRYLVPGITTWLEQGYHFQLAPYYPLILSVFIILQLPMLFGLVFGLLLLDERDDGTLAALQVTPLSTVSYVYYRIVVAILLSVFFILAALPLTGLASLHLASVFPIALVSGLFSMVLAVFLAAFAGNKVEGLALMKASGILALGPLAAYFINSNWQLALGILPSYWPAKAFWALSAGESAWPYIAVGLIYHILLLRWLLRRFQNKFV